MNDRRAEVMRWLCWGIVIMGIAIRLAVYLYNKSLWLDEATLAVNVLNRSFPGLLQRLEFELVSPPLLLVFAKAANGLWGHLEYSLRLLPLMSGCLSLYLFSRLVQRVLPNVYGLCAISLFSFGLPHVDWATSFKHYALDELAAVLALLAAVGWEGFSAKRRLVVAATFPWVIWMSYTSSFMLLSLALVALASWFRKKDRARLLGLLILVGSTAAAAVSVYVVAMRFSLGHEALGYIWIENYPSRSVVVWLGRALLDVFGNACEMSYAPAPALVICAFGALWLATKTSKRQLTLLAAGTIACAILASFLRVYPLAGGRLSIYWAPVALVLLASGLEALHGAWTVKSLRRFVAMIAVVVAVISVYGLFREGRTLFFREEMRDVLKTMRHQARNGEPILVSATANAPFRVYASPQLRLCATYMEDWWFPISDVYGAWLQAGQPSQFWVVMTGMDLNQKDAFVSELGPYARLEACIAGGRSAAVLVHLRGAEQWHPRSEEPAL